MKFSASHKVNDYLDALAENEKKLRVNCGILLLILFRK
jgi:hypothetical protein